MHVIVCYDIGLTLYTIVCVYCVCDGFANCASTGNNHCIINLNTCECKDSCDY